MYEKSQISVSTYGENHQGEIRAIKLKDTVGTVIKMCKMVTNTFKMEIRRFLITGRMSSETAFKQKQEMRNFNLFYNEPCNIYKQVLVAYNNREHGIMTH